MFTIKFSNAKTYKKVIGEVIKHDRNEIVSNRGLDIY